MDPENSTPTQCFSRALHFHPMKSVLVQRVRLMRKLGGGGGVKRLTNTKRLKQRLTEHTWEMEAELRVESFLFVSVQSEKAI